MEKFLQNLLYKGLECFGLYYSCYRGIITDNEDPDNRNRLKVLVADVMGNIELPDWALPMGISPGLSFPLKKGDMVWVQFQFGNPKYPVWSYGPVTEDDHYTKYNEYIYGLITRNGHFIQVNEEDNTIQIHQENGLDIILDNKNLLTIKNSDENFTQLIADLLDFIRDMNIITTNGPAPVSPEDLVKLKALRLKFSNIIKISEEI